MRDRESNTEPTTTSYALLGLLALRPWSAYELAGQMQRAIHLCWPKSERLAYAEPKRLVAMGLARQRSELVGQRRRTVYEITPAGRRALRAWLATTPAPPQLEFETMLRLIHADQGTTDDLLRALDSLAEHAERLYRAGYLQVKDYLDRGGPFPERLHIAALFADFYADYLALLRRWAASAAAEVRRWPSTKDLGMTAGTRRRLEGILARAEGISDPAEAQDAG